ncbi:ribosomal protein L7/L12 [Streptomyces sp. NPDC054956]
MAHRSCGGDSLAGEVVEGRGGCVEEPGFRVLLTEAGDRRMEAVRAARTITGLSLWNSKLLLDGAPVEITLVGGRGGADSAVRVFEDAGAHARITLLCDCCGRTIRRGAFPTNEAHFMDPESLETCWATGRPADST